MAHWENFGEEGREDEHCAEVDGVGPQEGLQEDEDEVFQSPDRQGRCPHPREEDVIKRQYYKNYSYKIQFLQYYNYNLDQTPIKIF